MPSSYTPHFVFHSPPFFSANWVGRHPHDNRPRMVVCFGPTLPDDFAALQATVLGLESVLQRCQPPETHVRAELEGGRLVLCSQDHELLRTDPLSEPLVNLLRWRPEVLLVWVDVPMADPQAELPTVGMEHVWTGLASVNKQRLVTVPDPERSRPQRPSLPAAERSAGLACS